MNAGKRIATLPTPMSFWPGQGDVMLAGDYWGTRSAQLVVLLHGGGQTRHAWKDFGETLGDAGYYSVAFDARGHGDSDWAENGDYSIDAKVADLLSLLAILDHPRPVLVGASMGGVTSLIAIGERFVDAAALVLIDIAPRVEIDGIEKIRTFMDQKPDGFESLEEVADAIATYQPHRDRPNRLEGLAKNVRIGEDGRFHWHWDPRTRVRDMDFDRRERRLSSCAQNITVPTLLIRGGLSNVLSEQGAANFLELCPHSEYVNVAGAAHMVAGDRNDIFMDATVDFLLRNAPAHQ